MIVLLTSELIELDLVYNLKLILYYINLQVAMNMPLINVID